MTDFTHYGWLHGLVPVYVNMDDDEAPILALRHWSVLPWALFCDGVFWLFCYAATAIQPEYEPEFAIKLTGEIS